ncbi:HD-GYP domain-containing protein [Effusibacillus lacus]|uniref:Uncharacterized protein n=1 Tax=Effusibacillus lacus TaxID=1348429 RepID=A0A292YQJ2_9BACL|nr:HD-GYP domain-containing protein [Effusibacillus lacus]TCS76847.1 putative nucleotidyltransferase with HDIG domain [Effusibacillus lacus]GAX91179.1 hypothetical protein EFBL_2845 [Effusibacillus lacus]
MLNGGKLEMQFDFFDIPGSIMHFAINDPSAFILGRLKEHHSYTYFHSLRVAHYSLELAKMMGLYRLEQQVLVRSALLHDVGKLFVAREILDKKERLNEEELRILRLHPQFGFEIVQEMVNPGLVDLDVLLYHHENLDGTGYPFGLTGKFLSLPVRIVRLADSFDAMTTVRAYNQPKSLEQAMNELVRWSGEHFDLEVVKIFEQYIYYRSM